MKVGVIGDGSGVIQWDRRGHSRAFLIFCLIDISERRA